ncbi:MAG: ribosome biogenesis GTPase Der [Planctomycetes bacterium]|nr:ribosome biogenesis GTPase Der [Planctomycetota bacterium]
MAVPQVAIVGRPNVGKSSLFNWLAGRRIAIVDPTPGVTRDRITAPVPLAPAPSKHRRRPVAEAERYFELTDTGGMGIVDIDDLTKDVERQINLAIDRADLLLFLVDAKTGPVPLDEDVARRLRGINKPVLLVANKCDHPGLDDQVGEFYTLGFGDVLCVSAKNNRGKEQLLELIASNLPNHPAPDGARLAEEPLKLAIVGRRNTGKSTFINCLAQEERTIVSEVEGTTRDSIDVRFEKDGKTILAIDTAGVRNRGSLRTDVEFYSLARAERSIRRADVVLHFLDAPKNISMVDKQLAGYVLENYKPAIFVVNKWDLLKGQITTGEFGEYIRKVFPSLDFVPIAFATAKEGKNVQTVLDLAQNLYKQAGQRVGTGDLNRVIKKAMVDQSPAVRSNRLPKVYYATQVAMHPPTIVLFTNGPALFDNTYQRYLLKTLRDHFRFPDVPIKLYLRARTQDTSDEEGGDAKPQPKRITRARPRKEKKKEVGELWHDV